MARVGGTRQHPGNWVPAVAGAELETARCQSGMTRTKSEIVPMNLMSPGASRELPGTGAVCSGTGLDIRVSRPIRARRDRETQLRGRQRPNLSGLRAGSESPCFDSEISSTSGSFFD